MTKENPVILLKLAEGRQIDETNYAFYAEQLISEKGSDGKRQLKFPKLTTSKLRSIYSMIMNLYTKIECEEDFDRYKSELQYLKTRMAYEAGREAAVKEFLNMTLLMRAIDSINKYEVFKLYCRYAESLVAYFKFYGGED